MSTSTYYICMITVISVCLCYSETEMARVEQERQDNFLEFDEDDDDDDLILDESSKDILQDSHNDDDLMLELEEFVNS